MAKNPEAMAQGMGTSCAVSFLVGAILSGIAIQAMSPSTGSPNVPFTLPEGFERPPLPQEKLKAEWLGFEEKDSRSFKKKLREPQPAIPAEGVMYMPYMSPVYRVNLKAKLGEDTAPQMNRMIADIVMDVYHSVMGENEARMKEWDAQEVNHFFFKWQTEHDGWSLIGNQPEWELLAGTINGVIDYYLSLLGKDQDFLGARSQDTYYWATVNKQGIGHDAHEHIDSLLSGVYYPKVPANAGQLMFQDPRGTRWPFNRNVFYIQPEEGDIILFPSWLMHTVLPTEGGDARVSIAFNVPGSWEDTTSISRTAAIPEYIKLGR